MTVGDLVEKAEKAVRNLFADMALAKLEDTVKPDFPLKNPYEALVEDSRASPPQKALYAVLKHSSQPLWPL